MVIIIRYFAASYYDGDNVINYDILQCIYTFRKNVEQTLENPSTWWLNTSSESYYSADDSVLLCEGSAEKKLDFEYFVLIWWQTDNKQEIPKQS